MKPSIPRLRMKFLFCLMVLLLEFPLPAAPGDVKWASVDGTSPTSGFAVALCFDGLPTSLAWNWNHITTNAAGFGQNSSFCQLAPNPQLVVTVTSMGFDDAGNAITVPRTLYGVKQMRYPWPNPANYVFTLGGDAVAKIALSDFIYAKDANVSVAISRGLYGTNNAATLGNITNNSMRPYPRTVACWSGIPWQMITNSTYTLKALAFQQYGQQFRPVRVVKFWAQDSMGNTNTPVYVTQMSVDGAAGDAVPVVEYIATMDATPFAEGAWVTNYFAAYPWVGDASTVVDCSDGANNSDAMYYHPFVLTCDRLGTYGSGYAVVDPVHGAINGTVSTNYNDIFSAVMPFQTIGQALSALAVTNARAFGMARSNWNNSFVYLKSGNYSWTGTAAAPAGSNTVWLTVASHPSASPGSVQIYTNSGAKIQRQCAVKFSGITMNWTSTAALIGTSLDDCWLDQCYCMSNGQSNGKLLLFNTNNYLTRCTIAAQRGGFTFAGGYQQTYDRYFLRGNTFTDAVNGRPFVFIGNGVYPSTNVQTSIFNDSAGAKELISPFVWAYNDIRRCDGTAYAMGICLNQTLPPSGGAVVQNLIEVGSDGPGVSLDIDRNANNWGTTNLLVWNNLVVGNRCHPPFESYSTSPQWQMNNVYCNNIFDQYHVMFDNYPPQDQTRTNRQEMLYMIGSLSNVSATRDGNDFSAGSPRDADGFDGINSLVHLTNRPDLWMGFIDHEGAAFRGVARSHTGNYQLNSSSPLIYVHDGPALIPYDLYGNPRGLFDPPGPLVSGNAKRGSGFLGF